MGISSSDGNTVSCCGTSGITDLDGNELRECASIDEERVYEENKKNEESKHILVECEALSQYDGSKGPRWKGQINHKCIDSTGKDITKDIIKKCVEGIISCNATDMINECNASSTIKAYGRFPVSEENKFSGDKVAIQVCFPNGKLNNNVLNFW